MLLHRTFIISIAAVIIISHITKLIEIRFETVHNGGGFLVDYTL